ncbi:MAG TPA: hypothetical protein VN132_05595, partial [Bdellovibrio sp.]|nr:hypothetical protein [Bdellovibrio sp.]
MSYLKIIMRFLFAFFIFYMSSGWLSNYVFVAMAAGCLICVSGFSFLKVSEKDDLVFLLFIVLACLNLAFHTELLQSPIQISSIAI